MQIHQDAMALVGSFSDSRAINETLLRAGEFFHLVSPATSCSRLPAGCEVVFAMVPIYPNETYPVGGKKRGLGRAALVRLSSAAGVTWDAKDSGRVRDEDEPVHPYYVHWRAVGAWRDLSTSWLPLVGDGLVDLRDGSAQMLEVMGSAKAQYNAKGDLLMSAEDAGRLQLRKKRAKALELAQSGAKLRAIRDIPGLTRAYEVDELWNEVEKGRHPDGYTLYDYTIKKPFLVARLQYVGTGDQEDRKAIRESFLGARSALFGSSPAPAQIASARPDITTDGEVVEEPLTCEFCGGSDDVREVRDYAGGPIRACRGTKCQELCHRNAAPPARPKPAAEPERKVEAETKTESVGTGLGVVLRFGRSKGLLLTAASDRELHWYAEQVERSLKDPGKSKYRAANEMHLADVTEEIARRGNRGPAAGVSQVDPGDFGGDDDDIPY